ncbi:Hypothetical protein SRAE_2000371100 [Strongyloides ratti]|uniref:Uncharacterized protein n=1 Tax=Strongyloides ratti TaxID=34506 RepID=A0A090MZJ8_STRRB|nr:Hypothetical protein SRAE_2000371100 [Strongyloides ratti]CEF69059.1 Hypothetical protein SRAE_2000371100 [Strongyloides ratti]
MNWSNNLDYLNLPQKIREKDKIIQHLTLLLEFQNSEIEDYKHFINSIEDQKNELKEKENTIDKLNEYKNILLSELKEKIEECTKNEQEIKRLNTEIKNLKVKNDKITERYENCKFLLDSKQSFDETVADILSSSDCSNSKISSYELYVKCDELADTLNHRNSDMFDLLNEVECLRSNNKRMHSEMSLLKNEIEELNNESSLKFILNPNFQRMSLVNLPSIIEEPANSLIGNTNIAIEIPETFDLINQNFDYENEEFYENKIADLEKKLLNSNQKLQELVEEMKNHKCQVTSNDNIMEDYTQSSTEENFFENNLVSLKNIKKIHKDEIIKLEKQIGFLKSKLIDSEKQENNNESQKKNTLSVSSSLISAIDYILSIVKKAFHTIIKKINFIK